MEKLKNFPFILIFLAYLAYLGVQYYQFAYTSEGQIEVQQTQLKQSRDELEGLKKKLVDGKKFMLTLDAKKEELRSQVKKLEEYQGVLSEGLDVPTLIKLLLTEAKRLQLRVDKIEPGRRSPKEYYIEQEFKLDLKGSFPQMVLFAQKIAQMQRVLRIESFSLKPTAVGLSRMSNQLDAQFSVRAYQYAPSKEDTMARSYK